MSTALEASTEGPPPTADSDNHSPREQWVRAAGCSVGWSVARWGIPHSLPALPSFLRASHKLPSDSLPVKYIGLPYSWHSTGTQYRFATQCHLHYEWCFGNCLMFGQRYRNYYLIPDGGPFIGKLWCVECVRPTKGRKGAMMVRAWYSAKDVYHNSTIYCDF